MARLIKDEKLNKEQREMVLAAFVHRSTVECPRSQWIKSHSFLFTNDGKQLVNRNEVPNYPLPW